MSRKEISTSSQDCDTGIREGVITAHLAATFAGLPVYVHTIEHADGVVLVDTADGLVVIGGDVAYTFEELGSGATEGQRRVLALAAPTWLTHARDGPRVPRPN